MFAAFLPLGLTFLMFVVGLRLTVAGLRQAFQRPRALLAGLVVQMAALPLAALILAEIFALPPALRTGLLIVAAAPGGITSNYAALLAEADVALSTAMTLVTNLVACITIPLVLATSGVEGIAGSSFLPLMRLSGLMFAVTALPLAVGLWLRHKAPEMVARLATPLDRASRIVFAAIVLATFYENGPAMLAFAASAGVPALLLNLAALAASFAMGAAVALPRAQTFAIAIEAGLQNVAMAIFVASILLGRSDLAAVGLVYAVVMNLTALALIAASRRRRAPGA